MKFLWRSDFRQFPTPKNRLGVNAGVNNLKVCRVAVGSPG